jgi:hypothetical protein
MKKLLLFIFIISNHLLIAQDYQNICSQGTTFYKGPGNDFMAFRRDSLISLGNNDTLIISYRAIRDTSSINNNNCADTTNGSVLGRKIIKNHAGWFCFFNRTGDSVNINTQATLNQSWKFCNLPANGYIEASVTAVGPDTVLGLIDQVKTITFQAKDSAGNAIPHILNQRSIRLSQHYGLSKMLDVYFIPGDTAIYVLAGKTNPVMGVQDLTWQEINNFDVGDVFHYLLSSVGTVSTIYKVLSKTSYGNDSVSYTMEHCSLSEGPSYPGHDTIITVHDTIIAKYFFTPSQDNTWLSRLPGEYFTYFGYADDYTFSMFADKNRRVKSRGDDYVYTWIYNGDTCWRNSEKMNAFTIYKQKYTEGLGKTMDYYYDYNEGQPQHYEEDLVYYKKGTATWGTPVSTDCTSLIGISPIEAKKAVTVSITPDPVETQVKILLGNVTEIKGYRFTLTDFLGRTILQNILPRNPYIFTRQGPPGLYFISIYDENGNLLTRTKLIFK